MTTLALAADARALALAAVRPAMLRAFLAYADSDTPASRIYIYATTRPAIAGDAPGGAPLVTIVLTKPCGEEVGGTVSLTQASEIGDLIAADGVAVWGRWATGNGDPIADGDVTDAAGDGPFRLLDADGVSLYAGGRAILGAVALT